MNCGKVSSPPFTFPWSLSGPIPGNLNQLGQAEASLPSFPPFRFRLPPFLPFPPHSPHSSQTSPIFAEYHASQCASTQQTCLLSYQDEVSTLYIHQLSIPQRNIKVLNFPFIDFPWIFIHSVFLHFASLFNHFLCPITIFQLVPRQNFQINFRDKSGAGGTMLRFCPIINT